MTTSKISPSTDVSYVITFENAITTIIGNVLNDNDNGDVNVISPSHITLSTFRYRCGSASTTFNDRRDVNFIFIGY